MPKAKKTSAEPAADSAETRLSFPLAVQLYTLRTLTIPPDEVLAAVAAAGYTGVELAGNYGLPAEALEAKLKTHGLKPVSAHVSLEMLEADLPGVVRFQKAVGNDTIIVPWVAENVRGDTAASWETLGKRLNGLGRRCRIAGMRFMYHNHDFEMKVIEGKPAIAWLLGAAEPENVGFEMDVAWVQFGGQSVPGLLAEYAGRVSRIHAKDLGDDAAQHGLADVGSGKLDWDAILRAAKAAGVEWLIVEHDYPSDPVASIRRSYEFLSGK